MKGDVFSFVRSQDDGVAGRICSLIDPATGGILTERTADKNSIGNLEHNLDYYHAQLLVSPNNEWIVDNGWGWHPVGIVRSWNLQTWTNQNVWESDDGSSVQEFALRSGCWGMPTCWIDETTVAIWGWGSGWRCQVPAVRLFDVVSGQELKSFFGPQTRPAGEFEKQKVHPSLFFDEYLISVSDELGTMVWNIDTGERLLHDESFAPIHYHPGSKEFLSITPTGFRLSRLTD